MILTASLPMLVSILALLASVLSGWMLRQSTGGRGLPGCGAGSGCDAVTRSRWSRWAHWPVAAPGTVLYVSIFAASLLAATARSPAFQRVACAVLLSIAPLAGGAAIWFIGL